MTFAQPITYDPDLDKIYVTTGNPQPVIRLLPIAKECQPIYTASICASTRRIPACSHGQHPGFAARYARLGFHRSRGAFRRQFRGQPRKLLAIAARNGKFFVLDRATGKAIVSTEFVKTNWSAGYATPWAWRFQRPEKVPSLAG